ncbi:MAG: dienelactone hydrolase family protein [Verrucomicrobia bacterium]|nr:dienelactone hydrolase family protein [Verrucomicrobiota bacterium]
MKLEAVEDFPGYTRRKVSYTIEAGVREDAALFVPKPAPTKSPAVVVFHQTVKTHYGQAAGYDASAPDLMMGPQLAARGYIVVCPRCFIFDDGADYKGNVAKMQARHPGWSGITRMTWDGIRAVDFLESLPGVDRARIGVIGHSLGAKESLYAAAFDERVRASVSCEGGVGLALSNWQDVWYLGSKIKEPGFARDHHELLALAAPRGFLLIGGVKADGDPSLPYLDAARPVFEVLGAERNLRFFNHGQGHNYPSDARKLAEAFLDEHLQR